MKILIAEDDAGTRLLLSTLLEKLGHEPVGAGNGREAWAAFERDYFPVLIADWLMPEMDGLELCRRIRAEPRPKYTYIILLTGLGGRDNYLAGMNVGADDFVTKPFDPEILAARLRVAERILGLQEEVKRLEGLLPICSYCKKIRDERDEWVPLDWYVATRTDAAFSHGICPECLETTVKPEMERRKRKRR
ncbi:MAG: response regulator transcription factor [Candidatus Rokubacteria bacterium]|nr:response regulator transcription factor [Candidatus Rokubacteria bacterium]